MLKEALQLRFNSIENRAAQITGITKRLSVIINLNNYIHGTVFIYMHAAQDIFVYLLENQLKVRCLMTDVNNNNNNNCTAVLKSFLYLKY